MLQSVSGCLLTTAQYTYHNNPIYPSDHIAYHYTIYYYQFIILYDLLKQHLSPFTNCHQKETITLLYYSITSYPLRSSPDRVHTKTHLLKAYPSFTPIHRASWQAKSKFLPLRNSTDYTDIFASTHNWHAGLHSRSNKPTSDHTITISLISKRLVQWSSPSRR